MVALVLFFSFSFLSCETKPRLFILLDSISQEFLRQQGIGQREIAKVARRHGFRLDMDIINLDKLDEAALIERIETTRPRAVFLSSLVADDPSHLAALFPEIVFISEGVAPVPLPGNFVVIEYLREDAFYQTGLALAALIDEPGLAKMLNQEVPLKVGVLVATGNSRVKREAEAFRNGFTAKADQERLLYREVRNLTDRAKARQLLERMKEDNVAVLILKVYTLNSFCLDFLKKEGGFAVVEDWWDQDSYQEVILLSLQEDFREGLSRVLALFQDSGFSGGVTVNAPVHLKWNERISFSGQTGQWRERRGR